MVETVSKKAIEKLQTLFEFANYPAQIHPLTPGSTELQLVVGPGYYMSSQGTYDKDRLVAVDIAFLNDILITHGAETIPKADYLQFMIALPFQVPEAKISDVSQLLVFFNLLVPIGAYCIHANGTPYFRYNYLVRENQEVEALVVIEIFNTIMFFVEHLSYKIEALAQGEKSLEGLLNEEIKFEKQPQKE